MSPLPVVAAALADVLVAAVDADKVKPGWLGFSVVLALIVALVVLLFSFSKHIKKVDFEEEPLDEDRLRRPDGTNP